MVMSSTLLDNFYIQQVELCMFLKHRCWLAFPTTTSFTFSDPVKFTATKTVTLSLESLSSAHFSSLNFIALSGIVNKNKPVSSMLKVSSPLYPFLNFYHIVVNHSLQIPSGTSLLLPYLFY